MAGAALGGGATAGTMTGNLEGAPLPSLAPADAQRAVAVLEEAMEKLAFLSSIEPDVLLHRDELSQAVGDEVARITAEQHRLESEYEALLERRAQIAATTTLESRLKPINEEIAAMAKRLRECTAGLARNLKDNPRVSDNLDKIVRERRELRSLLAATIEELQDSAERGHFNSLLRFVRKEKEAQEELERLEKEEKEINERVQELEGDVDELARQHDRDVAVRQKEIEQVKSAIRELKVRTTTQASAQRREAEAHTQAVRRGYEQAERHLQAEVAGLEQQLAIEDVAHRHTVDELHSQQADLQKQVEDLASKRSRQVEAMEKTLRDLQAERETAQEELERLRAEFERQQEEEAAEQAAAEEQRRLAEEAEEDRRRRNAAATLLQTVLGPAFVLANHFDTLDGGKKKKKKKGGKKKK